MAAADKSNGGLMFNTTASSKMALYTALVGGMSKSAMCTGKTYVTKGSPGQSLLYDKLANATPGCGVRMPPGDALSAADLETVRSWIMAGAPND
jgi:hypothetical protein